MWSRIINRPSVIKIDIGSLPTDLNSDNSVIALEFEEFNN